MGLFWAVTDKRRKGRAAGRVISGGRSCCGRAGGDGRRDARGLCHQKRKGQGCASFSGSLSWPSASHPQVGSAGRCKPSQSSQPSKSPQTLQSTPPNSSPCPAWPWRAESTAPITQAANSYFPKGSGSQETTSLRDCTWIQPHLVPAQGPAWSRSPPQGMGMESLLNVCLPRMTKRTPSPKDPKSVPQQAHTRAHTPFSASGSAPLLLDK